ncbi:hypothetical protein KVH27_19385 [Streptomyces olivaceus]|uniref:hypothetical protein n=1 Tax=Streptomyces olivaceus TaxID=47716 RepID=UPI001CCD8DD6|nr:hypothetical protein [Streptomyces olivaceus]MBZ6250531.1 hypothetical protein [Streptomyces olivaceus]
MTDQTTETARALLYRHGLPEDVIDGALCLHAQELAAVQRREAAVWGVDTAAGKHILIAADRIDPTRAAASAVPEPPVAAPAAPRETAAAVLAVVEAALGDTLASEARAEALAGITALLPAIAGHDTEFELRGDTEIRATALREAADFFERVLNESLDPDSDPRYCTAVRDVVMGLRRRADETAATETDDTVHACPGRWGGPDCRCFDDEPASGARQDGAQG